MTTDPIELSIAHEFRDGFGLFHLSELWFYAIFLTVLSPSDSEPLDAKGAAASLK